MHDSDLVETLAILSRTEREGFLHYLASNFELSQHPAAQDAAKVAKYVFECLDMFTDKLSKKHILAFLSLSTDFSDDTMEELTHNAVQEIREILKKDLNKRLSSSKNNITDLLSTLSLQERNELQQRLEKKIDPDKDLIAKLVGYYCQSWNDYEDALSEKSVYRKLFGNGKTIGGKLPKHRSETLKIVRRFVALETARNQMSDLQELVLLQKFFHERKCKGQYQRVRNLILRSKANHNQWSSLDYYHFFSSEASESNFQGDRNETSTDQNLWETIQSLDEYYLVERLWHSCQLLNQNQIAPLALPPFEEWWHIDLKSPHLKWFFDKPIGKLFTLAIHLLGDEDIEEEQALQDFIKFLIQHEESFSVELVSSFEAFAINFGIRRMNRGNFTYELLVFTVLQRRVEKGRIYKEGIILSNEFQSIAILGLRLGNFDWVREFIEKNKKKVVGMMPSIEYYQFCLACYLYYTNDLLASLHILMNADYEDTQSKIPARILEIKVLCELELSAQTKLRIEEQLDARIEAGILYFFRLSDVPRQRKKLGKRFMDFMKKIIRAKENRRWAILEKIRKEVESIDFIAERQWLLKIIDQYLEKSRKK